MQIVITKYHFSVIRIVKAESITTYFSKTVLRQTLLDNVGFSVNAYTPIQARRQISIKLPNSFTLAPDSPL